jgi:long-chain acyl-CoA synthetase
VTNDLGRVDADGFVWVDGRGDDTIIRGGFKIQPSDVERALLEHPQVSDAAVIGMADERLGQVPVAAIVLRAPVDDDQIQRHLRARLAPYMIPARLVRVDQIPRNEAMKIVRPTLLDVMERQNGRGSAPGT